MMMKSNINNNLKWEQFLSPSHTRQTLALIGVFMCGYEMLKTKLIEPVKDFYTNGFDSDGLKISEEYRMKVLARAKTVLLASAIWLEEVEALEANDLKTIERLTLVRNSLAHDLSAFLFNPEKHNLFLALNETKQLIHKVEIWWFINFELEVNPLYESMDVSAIDLENVQGGATLMLAMLEQVALANEEDAAVYLEHWRAVQKGKHDLS
jgi:hypothetical protein